MLLLIALVPLHSLYEQFMRTEENTDPSTTVEYNRNVLGKKNHINLGVKDKENNMLKMFKNESIELQLLA